MAESRLIIHFPSAAGKNRSGMQNGRKKSLYFTLHRQTKKSSLITLLEKLPRCAPKDMAQAVINRLKDFPSDLRRSITFDNGQENRHHTTMREALTIDTYFCEPYSSWQKGSVENAVGLTRRFWPKKTDYALISNEEIAMVEYRLNTRPRKRFGFLSPIEYAFRVALTA